MKRQRFIKEIKSKSRLARDDERLVVYVYRDACVYQYADEFVAYLVKERAGLAA